MKRKFSLTLAACVTALFGSAAMAGGEKLQFSADDRDGNGHISQGEMVAKLEDSGLFDRLDVNDNKKLEKDEADNDLIEYDTRIDVDQSGSLDRTEFVTAVFARFDDNDDNQLDEDEYADFAEQASEALES